MATPRMVFLGFGKYARADKVYALEPLVGDERGDGRRTRVWGLCIRGAPIYKPVAPDAPALHPWSAVPPRELWAGEPRGE